jgi:hypothetical protein
MSTEVIEKTEAAQQPAPKASNRRSAIDDVLGPGGRGSHRPPENSQPNPSGIHAVLHRIFEGHREFLGWTPD